MRENQFAIFNIISLNSCMEIFYYRDNWYFSITVSVDFAYDLFPDIIRDPSSSENLLQLVNSKIATGILVKGFEGHL
jgi:hypothetical protein